MRECNMVFVQHWSHSLIRKTEFFNPGFNLSTLCHFLHYKMRGKCEGKHCMHWPNRNYRTLTMCRELWDVYISTFCLKSVRKSILTWIVSKILIKMNWFRSRVLRFIHIDNRICLINDKNLTTMCMDQMNDWGNQNMEHFHYLGSIFWHRGAHTRICRNGNLELC